MALVFLLRAGGFEVQAFRLLVSRAAVVRCFCFGIGIGRFKAKAHNMGLSPKFARPCL